MGSVESRADGSVDQGLIRFFLLTVYCVLLIVFLVSCGRRGDPVLMTPDDEINASDTAGPDGQEEIKPDVTGTAEESVTAVLPEAPKGLAAVFAGEKVVLVWDDVEGRGVKFYRVYRSEGNGFSMIGEMASPVFNDRTIVHGQRYFYKVSAVGQSESRLSDPVEVVAGGE